MEKGVLVIFLLGVLMINFINGDSTDEPLLQKFSLHGDERCSDHGQSFTQNVRNLLKISSLVKSKTLRCACADFGVWSYSSKINFYGGEFGGSHLAVTKMEADKTCITLGKNASILSIRKVGNSDVRLPGMSFYVDYSLRGRELYFDGTFLQLPWPILFRSVGFTGVNASWALYPTTDASGDFTCMGQKENTLITYSSGSKMNLIGSVTHNGCLYPSGVPVDPSSTPMPSLALSLRDRSKILLTDSNDLRLPYPITVYSYTFSGTSNWTLFRGILFNGRSKCLLNTGDETGPQNFMDDEEEYPIGSLIVGSIRRGCYEDIHHVTSTQDEDYPTENDDIYDYEDGYGKVAALSIASRVLCSSIGLVILAIISL